MKTALTQLAHAIDTTIRLLMSLLLLLLIQYTFILTSAVGSLSTLMTPFFVNETIARAVIVKGEYVKLEN